MWRIWSWLSCVAVALFLPVSTLLAATSVWKVEKHNNVIYLVGTCHVLNAGDHPLPAEFNQAYKAAEQIIFETDIAATSSPAFQLKFLQALAVEQGKTLETSLKPATWTALTQFLKERNMPVESFTYYSPAGMTIMLTVMEYQRLGMSPAYGVDFHFNNQAAKDKKATGYLESIDEQLNFLSNMGKGQEDDMVLYTLQELAKAEEFIGKLKEYWRAGDMQALDTLGLVEMREKFRGTYEDLILKRNNNWMPHIEKMLTDTGTEAVMVGALHLAGPDGLLVQLKAKGYKVQQL